MKIFVTPDLSEKSKLGKPKSGCNFLNRKSQELKLAGFPRVYKYSAWLKFEQNLSRSVFTPKNENICDPGPVGKNQLGKPKSGCNFLNRKSQELKHAGFPRVHKYSVWIKFEQNLRGSFFRPKNENICDPGPVGKNQLANLNQGVTF